MADRHKERKAKEAKQAYEPEPEPKHYGVGTERLSAKEKYKDQFEKALEVMEEHIKKGVSKQDIVTLLNDRGSRTRTGREWTDAIVRSEVKRHNYKREATDNEVGLERTSIKDKYKDQFEKALEVMEEHIKKEVPKQDIVTLLNDAGFKTRTGRKWTVPILQSELKKFPDLNY